MHLGFGQAPQIVGPEIVAVAVPENDLVLGWDLLSLRFLPDQMLQRPPISFAGPVVTFLAPVKGPVIPNDPAAVSMRLQAKPHWRAIQSPRPGECLANIAKRLETPCGVRVSCCSICAVRVPPRHRGVRTACCSDCAFPFCRRSRPSNLRKGKQHQLAADRRRRLRLHARPLWKVRTHRLAPAANVLVPAWNFPSIRPSLAFADFVN